ncbi:MAG TPA: Mrp/NBP35 family ATP-binding protein [Caulobacteraceae bacterium]|jgi:ATP-binding protein involved in chromosome partitioning|nr:Mrp/NBP35 family ATP-binding protein [Caulobacteraceae bacterium]
MPATPDRDAVLEALDKVSDPKSGQGLNRAGLVRGLALGPGRAGFMLEVSRADAELYAPVRQAAERALLAVAGVETAHVVLTAESAPATRPARGARLSDEAMAQNRPRAPVPEGRPAHVKAVVAIASGKGGVGKSTVAVNLACALAHLGLRAGLLDADVYGPSAPTMLGVSDRPDYGADKKMVPKDAWGVKAMSIGLIVDQDQAMIWRGPMASQALSQMLNETRWGTEDAPLDILVVDLPPGTGDVQLTLVQKTKLDGAVIVSTPQEVALADARRAAVMFEKVSTPVIGLIENMAFFRDSSGAEIPIFGRGGARAEAARLKLPFLGEIPIDMALREGADEGRPLVATTPESPTSQAILEIAMQVRERLELTT